MQLLYCLAAYIAVTIYCVAIFLIAVIAGWL